MKDAQTPGRGTTSGSSPVWTDEERAAMVEHAKEQKKAAKRGAEPDGESDVLAKIAEMPDADRAMAERIHAIVKANAPDLSPRTYYGIGPPYASATSHGLTSPPVVHAHASCREASTSQVVLDRNRPARLGPLRARRSSSTARTRASATVAIGYLASRAARTTGRPRDDEPKSRAEASSAKARRAVQPR